MKWFLAECATSTALAPAPTPSTHWAVVASAITVTCVLLFVFAVVRLVLTRKSPGDHITIRLPIARIEVRTNTPTASKAKPTQRTSAGKAKRTRCW